MKKSTLCTLSMGSLLTLVFLCSGLFSVSGQVKTVKKVSSDLLPTPPPPLARRMVPAPFERVDMTIGSADKSLTLIEALSNGNTSQLLAELKALGLKNATVFGKKINGFLPVRSIPQLEKLKNLVYAEPVYKPVLGSGAAYTNGDKVLKSDVARKSRALDGRGIKIGVLSDSYNGLGGAPDGVFQGELPGESNPNGYTTEVQVLEDDSTGSDEGRAMIEIIHDIAPAANIAFHTAFLGEANFAQGIIDLANAGCEIITDDVSYLTEPFFQDGVIAQAVDKVVKEKGVSYYASAGNYDRNSYSSNFRDGGTYTLVNFLDGTEIGTYVMHDFDPGPGVDIFQEIVFAPGDNLRCAFQWDDPFASACSTCPGAKSDLDFFFALSEDTTSIFSHSLEYNIDGDPFEILGINYGGADTLRAYVAFGRWIGAPGPNPNPTLVKYLNFGSAVQGEYNTNSPTVRGHANSKYGISVGASAWFNTPAYGEDPAAINYFSSAGGVPVLFDAKGKKLRSPEVRMNPLFTAPDGGNTSFFGQMLNDGDAFPNFFGTSAAAPHTAAVMAQLRQMAAKRVTGKTIDKILSYTALDMDDPFTSKFDKGYDRKTGYGLIQADKAMNELLKKVGINLLGVYAQCSANPDSARNWKIHNPNPFAVEVVWELIGTTQRDTIMAMPGDNFLSTKTKYAYNLLSIVYRNQCDIPVCRMAYSPRWKCSTRKSTADDILTTEEEPTMVVRTYPNPFVSNVTVDLYSGGLSPIMIKIYSADGSEVYNKTVEPAQGYINAELDLNSLQKGIYFMKIFTSDGKLDETIKLMKQ